MKKLLLLGGSAALVLAGIVQIRTARYGADRAVVAPAPDVPVPAAATERLAASLRIQTVSHADPSAFDADAFRASCAPPAGRR